MKPYKTIFGKTENPCVAGSIPAHTTSTGSEKSEPFYFIYVVINHSGCYYLRLLFFFKVEILQAIIPPTRLMTMPSVVSNYNCFIF